MGFLKEVKTLVDERVLLVVILASMLAMTRGTMKKAKVPVEELNELEAPEEDTAIDILLQNEDNEKLPPAEAEKKNNYVSTTTQPPFTSKPCRALPWFEHALSANDFIVPLFVVEGTQVKEEIPSMPDYYRMSLDLLTEEVKSLWEMGLKSVLLFVKVPDLLKDNKGTEALNPEGLMQLAIKTVKAACPEMLVMTDVALDPYSSYGHDGIVEKGEIVNDATKAVLAQMALSHAQAGQILLPLAT